jgi:hypothetical protein
MVQIHSPYHREKALIHVVGVPMLGPTTTLQDVLYGLYTWLTVHPTETVLVSILTEQGPSGINDRKFEEILYATLNNKLAKKFWLQTAGEVINRSRTVVLSL